MVKHINTPQQDAFLNALFDNDVKGDIRKAMKKAGYSDTTATSMVVNSLKDQIITKSQEYLALNAGKAVMGLVGVLDNPNALGAKNAIAAANEVLDRVGITKVDDTLKNLPKGAIIYLPPKNSVPIIDGTFRELEKIEKDA